MREMKHSIQYRGKTITADSEEELKATMRELDASNGKKPDSDSDN